MRYLGIDLAWGEGAVDKPANESGVVALEETGVIVDAGWTVGIEATLEWIETWAVSDTLLFVDAPLLVTNPSGQRTCEKAVGQAYGRWKVSANSTNTASPRQAGVNLLRRLEEMGWRYGDGGPSSPEGGRVVSECYPYATLVGAREFGYVAGPEDRAGQRPKYKRPAKGQRAAEWKPERAANCDELIGRFAKFDSLPTPIDLRSHTQTASLVGSKSPEDNRGYKSREDLLDAAICAWTAALWHQQRARFRALGFDHGAVTDDPQATILAPMAG